MVGDTGSHGPSRSLAALGAAAAVVVITVALVATFGVARPPDLAPVDPATRPDLAIAALTWRDEGGQCLLVITPDADVREVRCGLEAAGPLLGWEDDGIVLLRYVAGAEQRETLDPTTGTTVARAALEGAARSAPALRLPAGSEHRDGELIVRDADGREIWRVEVAREYRIDASAFAVDGTLALLDSAGRLLLLPPDAAEPRVWVEDLGVDWADLIWQGSPVLRE